MPPHTALSTPLRAWQCSSCIQRTFSTSAVRAAVGPEHPQYISFPEPPQQDAPQTKWMKGILPVPRDVFSGKGTRGLDNEEVLEKSTKTAERHGEAKAGSREAWKIKLAEQRKRNLREGVQELKSRQLKTKRRMEAQQAQKYREHEDLVSRPERRRALDSTLERSGSRCSLPRKRTRSLTRPPPGNQARTHGSL